MNQNHNIIATVIALLGLLLAVLTFITPEIRCYFGLKTEIGCPADEDATNNDKKTELVGQYTFAIDQKIALPGTLNDIRIKLTGFDQQGNPTLAINVKNQPDASQKRVFQEDSTDVLQLNSAAGEARRLAFRVTKIDRDNNNIKLRVSRKY